MCEECEATGLCATCEAVAARMGWRELGYARLAPLYVPVSPHADKAQVSADDDTEWFMRSACVRYG